MELILLFIDGNNKRNTFNSTSSELPSFEKQNLNISFNVPSQSFDFEQNSIDGNRSSISGGSTFGGGIVVTPTLIREETLLDEVKFFYLFFSILFSKKILPLKNYV